MQREESPPQSGWSMLSGWPVRLSWLWLAIPFFGVLIRISVAPIAPNDYWWHLAAAAFFERTGQLLDANYFLYTLPSDAPFLNQPWLSQQLMYHGLQTGGHTLLALSRNGLAFLTWLGVVAVGITRCRDVRVLGGFAMLTVAVSGSVFAVRTQMLALPMFVAGFGLVVLAADRRLAPAWLWALVPATALWANMHGSFVLMPAMTGVVAVGLYAERWWRGDDTVLKGAFHWIGATSGMLAAGCLNPHGVEIYEYVVRLAVLSSVPKTVTEWQPPSLFEPVGATIIAGLVVSTLILAWRWRKLRWWEGAVFVVTGWMAATSLRSIFWWEVAALWIVPRHLSAMLGVAGRTQGDESPGTVSGLVHLSAILLLGASAVLVQPGMPGFKPVVKAGVDGAKRSGEGALILNQKNPIELVEHVASESRRGDPNPQVFHHQSVGGLLAFSLGFQGGANWPTAATRRVAFVDQRMEMIPESVWADYFKVSRTESGWRDVIRRHHINWMLLYEPKSTDDSTNKKAEQAELLEAVRDAHVWKFVEQSGRWRLFRRSGPVGAGPGPNGD